MSHGGGPWHFPGKIRMSALVKNVPSVAKPPSLSPSATLRAQESRHFHRQALDLYRSGRGRQSLALFEAALAADQGSAGLLRDYGLVLIQLGEYGRALRVYDGAIRLAPGSAELLVNRGLVLKRLGRVDEAAESYRKAIAADPTFAEAHNNLGNALLEAGKPEEALLSYETACALKPHYIDAFLNAGRVHVEANCIPKAQAAFTHALAINARAVRAHEGLARCLWKARDYDAALRSFESARSLDPADLPTANGLAQLLLKMGRLDEAVAAHDRLIALAPEDPQAYLGAGRALFFKGEHRGAAVSFDKAVSLDEALAEAHAWRARALEALDMPGAALASFDKAIALEPEKAEWHLRRAAFLLGVNGAAKALESAERAIELKAGAPAEMRRIEALIALRRFAEALGFVEGLLADGGSESETLCLQKADCLDGLGRREEAVAWLKDVLGCMPTSEQFRYRAASFGAQDVLAASPKVYVQSLFDGYAPRFERHLLGVLQYNTPQKLYRQFSEHLSRANLDCLDLGCGTGLGVEAYRASIRSAVGVDLSEKMLEKARAKGLYADLVCADIVDYLETCPHRFDLVLCCDVLVYVGALELLFAGVRKVLRPGGVFAFSTEVADTDRFELKKSLRYGHSRDYIEQLAAENGLQIAALQRDVIRQEHGEGLEGYLVHLLASSG